MAAVEFTELDDGIAGVTLNRPDLLNAIDGALLDGIDEALDKLSSWNYRVAVLTGAGRGFCAGADLSGTGQPWTPPAGAPFKTTYDSQVRLADQMTRLYELPIPVVAAVNGVAVGGGLAYALHCDIRIASEAARFGSVFIKAGFSSMDMGTSYLLPKIVGAGVARELMARTIAANNAFGVWQTKTGLNAALDAPSLRHAKEIENRTQVLTGFTKNPMEAAMAHREKRAPTWDPL